MWARLFHTFEYPYYFNFWNIFLFHEKEILSNSLISLINLTVSGLSHSWKIIRGCFPILYTRIEKVSSSVVFFLSSCSEEQKLSRSLLKIIFLYHNKIKINQIEGNPIDRIPLKLPFLALLLKYWISFHSITIFLITNLMTFFWLYVHILFFRIGNTVYKLNFSK